MTFCLTLEHWSRTVSVAIAVVMFCVAGGCREPRKPEAPASTGGPGVAQPEPGPKAATPARAVAAGNESVEVSDEFEILEEVVLPRISRGPGRREMSIADKLKKLKFKARRDVMWARTTVANIPSYQRALEKYDAEFERWGMYQKVPTAPKLEELRKEVEELAERLGLTVTVLKVKDYPITPRDLPELIRGERAFDFEDNDLRGVVHVTMLFDKVEAELLRSLVAGLKAASRLTRVRRLSPKEGGFLLNADCYYFIDTSFPIHIIEEKDLEKEMGQSGIEMDIEEVVRLDPIGSLQSAALSYKEFNLSLPELNEAMKLLSESRFKSARSEFFRSATARAMEASPLP